MQRKSKRPVTNNNEKRFTRDDVAGRTKFRMLTFHCHYFHNFIPETNEQTGFFLLRILLEKLGRVRRSDTVWKVVLLKVKEVLIYKVPRKLVTKFGKIMNYAKTKKKVSINACPKVLCFPSICLFKQ